MLGMSDTDRDNDFQFFRFWLRPHFRNSKAGDSRQSVTEIQSPWYLLCKASPIHGLYDGFAYLGVLWLCLHLFQSSHHPVPHSPVSVFWLSRWHRRANRKRRLLILKPHPLWMHPLQILFESSWAKQFLCPHFDTAKQPSKWERFQGSLELTCHEFNVQLSRLQLYVLP